MSALIPRPVRTACSTQNSLITGSMPGIAASTSETLALGSAPKRVEAPENSFASERTWACTSIPMTISHSPSTPEMRCAVGSSYAIAAAVFFLLGFFAEPPDLAGAFFSVAALPRAMFSSALIMDRSTRGVGRGWARRKSLRDGAAPTIRRRPA